MSPDLGKQIKDRYLEIFHPPQWLNNLKVLDPNKFPDSVLIEELAKSHPVTPLLTAFREELKLAGVVEKNDLDKVFKPLFHLWQMKVGDKRVADHNVTLGDIRGLNRMRLSLIDGIDEKGEFSVEIVSRLFGLK